ncbi:PRECURSOR OF CEP4 [Salix viminalis]|uniref:PRECURSOR OF CEP4 n=1 Tax=Salix viminalis TaxID=40686 RepID=A0A6N2KEL8_SALVM|nr:PRECURSOR OF CEP4 [Salix viminalis]
MADKTRGFTLTFFTAVLLLLHQHFDLTAASRPLDIHSPAIPGPGSLRNPRPPPADIVHDSWYRINRYKNMESDAFRPTTPGHSPGVGHEEPPSAP